MNKNNKKKLHPLVLKIIYGDIQGVPLSVLGEEAPSWREYNIMDEEQGIRIDLAAFVQDWFDKNEK